MSFTFNSISSDTMGLIVEKYPPRPFPARKVNIFNVPGRNGDLIVDQNAFENVIQEYEVYIKGGAFQTKASAIANWLLSPACYQRLEDSYDPTVYREARFVGGVDFINSLNKYGRATIQFDCKPQRFPITPEVLTATITSSSTVNVTVPNSDGMFGCPLILFERGVSTGSHKVRAGIASTNGMEIEMYIVTNNAAGAVYLDFENATAYPANSNTSITQLQVTGSDNKVQDGSRIYLSADPNADVTIYTRRYSV